MIRPEPLLMKVLISQKNNRAQDNFYDFAVFSKMNGEFPLNPIKPD